MIRLIPLICCMFAFSACHIMEPHLDVYDGLLPPGYLLKESPNPINAEALKDKTAVIVTSKNFDNYTTRWQKYYEKENRDKKNVGNLRGAAAALSVLGKNEGVVTSITGLADAIAGGSERIRKATDPNNVVDVAYYSLRPYFKSVLAASDFAEARDLKADYIILIDYFTDFNSTGSVFLARGGAYMLDSSLQRVLQAEGSAEVDRDVGSSNFFLPPAPGQVMDGTARTMAKGLNITMRQIVSGIQTKLGPVPIKTIAQEQAIAPESKNKKSAPQRISELKELKEKGLITEAEFQAKKNKILEEL